MASYSNTQIFWVPHPERAYARAELVSGKLTKDEVVKLRLEDSGDVVQVKASSVLMTTIPEEDEFKTTDLTRLPDLNHAALLQTLNSRFDHDEIYTYTGKILIAVNPFKLIKPLYSQKMVDSFTSLKITDSIDTPHCFGIAHQSYMSMLENKGRNQSILVSGESGAGKTETTKKVMKYLTTVSQLKSAGNGSEEICERVLNTNPLLEAFGNAKTVRNDNSSRFGKLIQMQFEPGKYNMIGATIDTYLLEKGRVTHQADGERNFHIFYELEAGATAEQKRKWNLPKLTTCRITNQSNKYNRDDVDDQVQFRTTLQAMGTVGIKDDERERVFSVVVAVMHLSNIVFDEVAVEGGEGSKVSQGSMSSAKHCCDLLGVTVEKLEHALCKRSISAGVSFLAKMTSIAGELLTKDHTVQQANDARDALAKTLYERLFLWLVWRVNSSIRETGEETKKRLSLKLGRKAPEKDAANKKNGEPSYINDYSVGCLDIFGFEVFESNSFEQLCINYANEVLQQQFNEYVFTIEQELYQAEGIDWTRIEFPDNKDCIDMIEGKPIGLLRLIDEECMYPQGSDDTLHQKLISRLPQKFARFTVDPITQKNHKKFTVKHFAGDVEYEVTGFYEKNKNELRQEAVDFVRSSNDDFIKILLPADATTGKNTSAEYFQQLADKGQKQSKKMMRSSFERRRGDAAQKIQQRTVGTQFKEQLGLALEHIRASEPHYIRCVKPNDRNVPEVFNRVRVLEQLNYSGVLEVVRVARAGYSSRFTMKEFVERFVSLAAKKPKSRSKADIAAASQNILDSTKMVKFDDYQVGFTRVFLRAAAYTRLERLKAFALTIYAKRLQRAVRKWLVWSRANRERLRHEEEKRRAQKLEEEKRREAALQAERERQRVEEERKRAEEAERLRVEREKLELERMKLEMDRAERIRLENERIRLENERKEQERLQKEKEEAEKARKREEERQRKEREVAEQLLRKKVKAAIVIQSFARMILAQKKVDKMYEQLDAYEQKMDLLEQQRKIYGELFEDVSSSDESDDEDADEEALNKQSLYITGGAVAALFLVLFPKLTMYLVLSALCVGGGGMFALEYQKTLPKTQPKRMEKKKLKKVPAKKVLNRRK